MGFERVMRWRGGARCQVFGRFVCAKLWVKGRMSKSFLHEIKQWLCVFRLAFLPKNVSFAVETKHEERNNGNSVIANRHRLGR